MSYRLDATKVKKLYEATPKGLFKPATDADVNLRNEGRELRGNIRKMCDVLLAMKITKVVFNFAGSGDSGQVDDIEWYSKTKVVEEPSIQDGNSQYPASDLMDNITEIIQGDWYNNDGGQGSITLDTKTRLAVVDVGYNYMEVNQETEEHQF